MENKAIKKDSVVEASRFFLTSSQNKKNKIIDKMFKEQPSLLEFMEYLDKALKKEPLKEVIIQLMSIFYYGISIQKIKLKRIPFTTIMNSLTRSAEMKNYFHNVNYKFDRDSFKVFFEGYAQKEILNYTYFAINNQFRNYIETENDGVLIFYIMKIFGDAVNENIR